MVGAKRRRMRSGGNVSTLTNNAAKDAGMDNMDDEKTAPTSKCKGATTIPIFLKKTYKMIDTCDQSIASWTADGDMFVVKDPDLFATNVIPQYFDHNKFSSFARQLNFYGFRKMQSKPIRNSDFDANTAKHVTFYNENFKRGRCDLLKKIQRSTRGGGGTPGQDQSREVQTLKEKVATLEKTITDMGNQMEERMRRLELDMLGRMEQMMLAMQQQQQQNQVLNGNVNNSNNTSNNDVNKGPSSNGSVAGNSGISVNTPAAMGWDPLPYGARGTSIGSISGLASLARTASLGLNKTASGSGPTLPPHPKQKQLPTTTLPGALSIPPARLSSLRGISNLSRGISSLSRGASIESQSSALLSNTWEDKFFSMLMSGDKAMQQGVGVGDTMNPTPMNPNGLNPAIVTNGGLGQMGA